MSGDTVGSEKDRPCPLGLAVPRDNLKAHVTQVANAEPGGCSRCGGNSKQPSESPTEGVWIEEVSPEKWSLCQALQSVRAAADLLRANLNAWYWGRTSRGIYLMNGFFKQMLRGELNR